MTCIECSKDYLLYMTLGIYILHFLVSALLHFYASNEGSPMGEFLRLTINLQLLFSASEMSATLYFPTCLEVYLNTFQVFLFRHPYHPDGIDSLSTLGLLILYLSPIPILNISWLSHYLDKDVVIHVLNLGCMS
jgi:hypothetical protein